MALAIFVWRARPENAVNRWFAAQTLCLASWVCGVGGLQGGAHLDAWGRFTFASASLIPASFLGFTRCYPTPNAWPSIALLRSTFLVGAILAFLSLTTSLVAYDNVLTRSEEHTSELQSQSNLVCRLLLEKKKTVTFNRKRPSVARVFRCRRQETTHACSQGGSAERDKR